MKIHLYEDPGGPGVEQTEDSRGVVATEPLKYYRWVNLGNIAQKTPRPLLKLYSNLQLDK